MGTLELSQRRVCKAVGQPRSTQRHKLTKPDTDKPLVARMQELAAKNPRYGYRRIHAMLEQEGFKAGRDRVHRLWCQHGLRVPKKTHKRRLKSIARAGVEPWENLFQNLRASRETELASMYPLADVCRWLGNSPTVAAGHYLMPQDRHFADADATPTNTKTTQKTTRHAAELARTASQPPLGEVA